MARARNLKPSFFTDDELAEVPPLGRLLFQGLWCMADREGRLEDRPKKIKAEILPYDEKCSVDRLLADLAARRYIIRYESGGNRFIQVRQFKKHQNPHVKEPPSTIPAPGSAPTKSGASTGLAPEIPEATGLIVDSGFPLPDSGLPLPPSGPRLADPGPPDSGLPQTDSGGGATHPKVNGAEGKSARSTPESGGQDWSSPVWVNATAITVDVQRRENEPYDDFKDRVHSALRIQVAKAAAQHKGRAHA